MPNLKEHCNQSKKIYGYDFKEVHSWMDYPCRSMTSHHRKERHDIKKTPVEVKKIFWDKVPKEYREYLWHVAIDHISLDFSQKENSFLLKKGRCSIIRNHMFDFIEQIRKINRRKIELYLDHKGEGTWAWFYGIRCNGKIIVERIYPLEKGDFSVLVPNGKTKRIKNKVDMEEQLKEIKEIYEKFN